MDGFYQVNSLRYARHVEDSENAGGMNAWNEASDTWPKGEKDLNYLRM